MKTSPTPSRGRAWIVLMAVCCASSLLATPMIKVGDKRFLLADDKAAAGQHVRKYLMRSETFQNWSRLVSVREVTSLKEPKAYVDQLASDYRAKFPDMRFSMQEDGANGDWLIDYIDAPSDPEAKYVEWDFFRARRFLGGIVVYQYAVRLRYKETALEISQALSDTRKSMFPILEWADFAEQEDTAAP